MVVSIFLSIFAEKLIDMHYNYGKTKVVVVKAVDSELEKKLQERIDNIEKENGYIVDIKIVYRNICYVGVIIYKCTDIYEQAKKQ